DLTEYLYNLSINVRYLHSDIKTLERTELIQGLRKGDFDVLVGINLLREGLDMPEVSLVAILDADKEGFLRSETSLVQTIGRAARNVDGRVVLYADKLTDSMINAINETNRRRAIQEAYNKENNITPESVKSTIHALLKITDEIEFDDGTGYSPEEKEILIRNLEDQMLSAAKNLDFEHAAKLRDRIFGLQNIEPRVLPKPQAKMTKTRGRSRKSSAR
ncbi:MAG: excinuclease ABC subunit B, partial [Christensenellaceae bacterium]|nr:excinuclease ABC subunit B [Christensenellaceae bacterium]